MRDLEGFHDFRKEREKRKFEFLVGALGPIEIIEIEENELKNFLNKNLEENDMKSNQKVVVLAATGERDLQDKVNIALNAISKNQGKLDHVEYLQDTNRYTAIIHYKLPKEYLKKTVQSIKKLKDKAQHLQLKEKLKEKGKKLKERIRSK